MMTLPLPAALPCCSPSPVAIASTAASTCGRIHRSRARHRRRRARSGRILGPRRVPLHQRPQSRRAARHPGRPHRPEPSAAALRGFARRLVQLVLLRLTRDRKNVIDDLAFSFHDTPRGSNTSSSTTATSPPWATAGNRQAFGDDVRVCCRPFASRARARRLGGTVYRRGRQPRYFQQRPDGSCKATTAGRSPPTRYHFQGWRHGAWYALDDTNDRPGRSDLQARLTGELGALRQCREWLERLDRGERVVVNLRPETDPETEYVAFDRPRVLRVLARIIADLDDLAGNPPIAEEEATQGEDAEARRVRHRRRLAEPDPPPKRLSVQEERAALGDALGLPPHKRGR